MNAQIVLFDGFDLLDVVAPYEALVAAASAAPGRVQVELVSREGARDVRAGLTGTRLAASAALDERRADLIIVPGAAGPSTGEGDDTAPAILGRAAAELGERLAAALARPGCTVATVCGGSLVLALAGLLEGRPAVTHHLGLEILAAAGARVVRARVVDDGDLVSAGGVTSGLDLALHLVERSLGPRVAHAIEDLFEYERRGTVWRESGAVVSEAFP